MIAANNLAWSSFATKPKTASIKGEREHSHDVAPGRNRFWTRASLFFCGWAIIV